MSKATAMRPLRVQIVGDDRATADALSTLVQTWDYETYVDYGMVTALQTAFFARPDVMLLDTGPTESSHARLVVEEVRQHADLKATTLVAISTCREEVNRARALESGFDGYLVKPLAPAILRSLLKGRELALTQKGLVSDLVRLGTEQQRLLVEVKAKLRKGIRPWNNP
jgi:DNA-binding response OmpR family regulator